MPIRAARFAIRYFIGSVLIMWTLSITSAIFLWMVCINQIIQAFFSYSCPASSSRSKYASPIVFVLRRPLRRSAHALTFYREHLGAQVIMLMGFKGAPTGNKPDNGCASIPPNSDERRTVGGEIFQCAVERWTSADAYMETFFAKRFGMVQDKFGVSWMVLCGVMSHLPDLAGTTLARLTSYLSQGETT